MPEIRANTAMPGQLSRMFDIQHRPLSHTRRTTEKIARAAALIRALLDWLERQRDRDDDADAGGGRRSLWRATAAMILTPHRLSLMPTRSDRTRRGRRRSHSRY